MNFCRANGRFIRGSDVSFHFRRIFQQKEDFFERQRIHRSADLFVFRVEPSRIVLISLTCSYSFLKKVIVSESVIRCLRCSIRRRGVSMNITKRLKKRKRRCKSNLKPLAFVFWRLLEFNKPFFVSSSARKTFSARKASSARGNEGVKLYKFILINAQNKVTLWTDGASSLDLSFA